MKSGEKKESRSAALVSEMIDVVCLGQVSGKPGVLIVTSGPGATNAVTPMQDARSDGTPLVVLAGQVPTSLVGTDAFQEADVVGITRSCTKWSVAASQT